MQMVAMLMAMITLLGVPQGGGTESEISWETVAVQILEEPPETAARTLLDWAETGRTAPEREVESFLKERTETAAEAAAAFAAVLDAADSLRAAGEGPELGEETYREAVRSLSAFFTRLLETETTPWREEPSDWPTDLAAFDGIWCDSTAQELLIFRNGTCRVVIPWLGAEFYGETAYAARLRDRSGVGYCPSLEIDFRGSGTFQGPLAYYVSGLTEDHFWCNTQAQRFDKLWPVE
ncbi:hypothetical protein [uncultured Oscillibacter sp.]|uniref:hypothetical protein n=1 Tax=uncultured Oscillibacter sp. TaxID=876091 RepID=UPI0028048C58|nr:hypothetical protein [uncultured Oscillibacter sp.]